jgi:hypothetical protein
VHLNNDDLAYLELPTDEEATESAAEQRALMASFETQRRNEAAGRLMAAERRAAADDLAVRTNARANRHISVTWRWWTRRGRKRRDCNIPTYRTRGKW